MVARSTQNNQVQIVIAYAIASLFILLMLSACNNQGSRASSGNGKIKPNLSPAQVDSNHPPIGINGTPGGAGIFDASTGRYAITQLVESRQNTIGTSAAPKPVDHPAYVEIKSVKNSASVSGTSFSFLNAAGEIQGKAQSFFPFDGTAQGDDRQVVFATGTADISVIKSFNHYGPTKITYKLTSKPDQDGNQTLTKTSELTVTEASNPLGLKVGATATQTQIYTLKKVDTPTTAKPTTAAPVKKTPNGDSGESGDDD